MMDGMSDAAGALLGGHDRQRAPDANGAPARIIEPGAACFKRRS
jgi:hypothetical protein